jgi:hypothetical protein
MSDITVKMKDGTKREFKDRGAPGGSYSNSVKYEGMFAIIEDAYGNTTSIPSWDILEIYQETARRNW